MAKGFKLIAPLANEKDPNVKFALLPLGNFKDRVAFRKSIINKYRNGQFCFVDQQKNKYFIQMQNGRILDEEVRANDNNDHDNQGPARNTTDREDRALTGFESIAKDEATS